MLLLRGVKYCDRSIRMHRYDLESEYTRRNVDACHYNKFLHYKAREICKIVDIRYAYVILDS
jgi:hypothetical protein